MSRMFCILIALVFTLALWPLLALAEGDAGPPVSPEQIEGILSVLVALATKFGYGGIAILVVSVLGLVGLIARAACQWLIDGGNPVPAWLSWLPVLSSVSTVNPVVGKGNVLPKADKTGVLARLNKLLIILLACGFVLSAPLQVQSQEAPDETPAITAPAGTDCEDALAECEADRDAYRAALWETQGQLAAVQADPLFGLLNHFGFWQKLPPKTRLAIGIAIDCLIIGASTWLTLEAQPD